MSMNSTPQSERIHIGFFGKRNAGKSSLVNRLSNQQMSVVSDTPGTTTDPVKKSMEILPLGPVVLIDTPGLDDEGELGKLRVNSAEKILNTVDIAVLVTGQNMTNRDEELLNVIKSKNIPYVIVKNKSDLYDVPADSDNIIHVSAKSGMGIEALKQHLGNLAPKETDLPIISDLLNPKDIVILVTPIDTSAPKGRLILPQVQTLRDILDANAIGITVQPHELSDALKSISKKPVLVVCDSQVFKKVNEIVPKDIKLTSFSILMARKKGLLETAVRGVKSVKNLKDGDKILIAEGCTHHRQCGDICTQKIPGWLKAYTGKNLQFEFSSGKGFPENLSSCSLIVHCGGCMLTEREMLWRMKNAEGEEIPLTNFGTMIAQINGILDRSLEIFE